jgi:arylsulfatase A-like enzyme
VNNRPNIIYFHTHDTGRYVSPYGYAVPSPNYQRLAESGLTFKRMHCVAPTCSPSRAGLVTGQYPHQNGMISLAHRGAELNDYGKHIVHQLGPAGYHTCLIGFQHVAEWLEYARIGYDEVMASGPGSPAAKIGPLASEWLRQQADAAKPFFLSLGITETHRPFPEDVPESEARYVRPPAPFPDRDVFRRDMAAFCRKLEQADMGLGMVLDVLEQTGLRENTLVICTTDHGVAFPSMKNNLTDHGTGVLFILSGPGIPQGEVTDALATHLDVFPTLCELLGIDAPDWLEGESLVPVLQNPSTAIHQEVFTESNYHGYGYHPYRCVRTDRWAYIQGFEDNAYTSFPRSDASPSAETWTDAGWGTIPAANERLFDQLFDPHEVNNRAGDPDCTDVLTALKTKLHAHLTATDDPILNGPIPPPKGAPPK